MAKRYFRNNGQQGTPARLAEDKALLARNKAYDDAREKAVRVLQALKGWPAYDATGNISGAIDHTLANIEALDAALDELHEQIDKFRGQKSVQLQVNIPKTKGPRDVSKAVEAKLTAAIKDYSERNLVQRHELSAYIVDPAEIPLDLSKPREVQLKRADQ